MLGEVISNKVMQGEQRKESICFILFVSTQKYSVTVSGNPGLDRIKFVSPFSEAALAKMRAHYIQSTKIICCANAIILARQLVGDL